MDVIVETADLGRCIRAVLPHVSRDKDDVLCQHIELRIAPTGDLLLSATDRYTAVVAVVSVVDNATGEASTCHLLASDAKNLVAMFKATADATDGQERVRLVAARETLQVIDYSGLFAGKEAVWPAAPRDDFPDVPALVRRIHGTPAAAGRGTVEAFAADHVARFGMSAKALHSEVSLRRVSSERPTFAVLCGEDLAGALMGARFNAEDNDARRRAWEARLSGASEDPLDVGGLVVDLEDYLRRWADEDRDDESNTDDDTSNEGDE